MKVRNQRVTRSRQDVEERGLADIRPADKSDDGQHGLVNNKRRRSDRSEARPACVHCQLWAHCPLSAVRCSRARLLKASTLPESVCTKARPSSITTAFVIRSPSVLRRATISPLDLSSQCR